MQSLSDMFVPATHAVQLPTGNIGILPEGAMNPPPDSSFPTRDALLDYLKKWAANQGYAVVIGRSRTNRLWIRCDRGGEYRDKHANNPSARQRKRKQTRLTGCEFSIKAYMRKDGLWRSRCECPEHNHGPSEDLREHPSLRRMNDEQLNKVYELTASGKCPAVIMDELSRLWPDIKVIRRDIYNARKNFKIVKNSNSLPSGQASASSFKSTSGTTSINASSENPTVRLSGSAESVHWPDNDLVETKKRKIGPSSRGSDTPATQRFTSATATAADGPSSQPVMDRVNIVPTATDSPLQKHPNKHLSWPQLPGSAQRAEVKSPTSAAHLPTTGASTGKSLAHAPLRNLNGDLSAAERVRTPSTGAVAAPTHFGAQMTPLSYTPSFFPQAIPNGNSTAALDIPSQIRNDYHAQPDRRPSSAAYLQTDVSNQQPATTKTTPDASRRSRPLMASLNTPPNVTQAGLPSVPAVGGSRRPSSATSEITASTNEQTSNPNDTAAFAQHHVQQLQQTGRQQTQFSSSPFLLEQHAAPGPQLVPAQGLTKTQNGAVLLQRIEKGLYDQKGMLSQILDFVQNLDSNRGGVLSAPPAVSIGDGPVARNGSP